MTYSRRTCLRLTVVSGPQVHIGTSLGTSRGWAKPLHACRPAVGTQAPFRNSSLRGSIPKGNLEGGQADPPQNPQELQTAWSAHFQKSMDFRKRPATKVWQALLRPWQVDAEGSPKIWRALPRPLAGTSPKGSYFAPP